MRSEYRDGLLAVAALLGLVSLAAVTVGVGRLLDPRGVLPGIVAAVGIEVLFLQYPSQTLGYWERRGVPLVGLCVVLVAGLLAVRTAPWLLAVPVWGLVTYLCLLGCVLAGVGNPVAVLLSETE